MLWTFSLSLLVGNLLGMPPVMLLSGRLGDQIREDVLLQVSEVRVLKRQTHGDLLPCSRHKHANKWSSFRQIHLPIHYPSHHVPCVTCIMCLTCPPPTHTHPHICSHSVLIISVISIWMETKFDKATNDECNLGNSLFFLLPLSLCLMHHVFIITFPNVLFWDLLFHISTQTNLPVIIICHCCRGDDIYSHMMASQGDQEVVLTVAQDWWGLWVNVAVVCMASFLDLCEGCNDIIFNNREGHKLDPLMEAKAFSLLAKSSLLFMLTHWSINITLKLPPYNLQILL